MDNINEFLLWVSGGSVLATIIISSIKKLIKNKLVARWGDLGIQVVLFAISILIAFGAWGFQFLPKEVLTTAIFILTGSNAIYQIIFKAIYRKAIGGQLDPGEK